LLVSVYEKRKIINYATYCSIDLQPSQPVPSLLYLGYPRVSVLPEVEEFLVMLDGFGFPNFFLVMLIINLSQLFLRVL
jgi:hypothetical protein